MMITHFLGRAALAMALAVPLFGASDAVAQQDPGFFIPGGQGGGRPPQAQGQIGRAHV